MPSQFFVPAGASINGVNPGEIPEDDDSVLFQIDFIREVNELVREICAEKKEDVAYGFNVQLVALSLQERQREGTIEQVKDLLKLAAKLTWYFFCSFGLNQCICSSNDLIKGSYNTRCISSNFCSQ